MTLGEKLKQARLEAGLSQRQLCGDVITRNMLSQIENGSARPSMDTLKYLASRLGKPVSYFLEEEAEVPANLAVMERWFRENPDIEFRLFLSPYSMLFWDKASRLGETDALLTAMEQICTALLEHENVSLYGYLMDREFVEDLDNYCDHIHHSAMTGDRILAKLAADEGQLTKENLAAAIANWREFVVNYDYEKFWDGAFWIQWAADKAAGKVS